MPVPLIIEVPVEGAFGAFGIEGDNMLFGKVLFTLIAGIEDSLGAFIDVEAADLIELFNPGAFTDKLRPILGSDIALGILNLDIFISGIPIPFIQSLYWSEKHLQST